MEQSCKKVKQITELFQIKTDINLIQQTSSCYEKIATLHHNIEQNEASELWYKKWYSHPFLIPKFANLY